jgi:hypothetical protein
MKYRQVRRVYLAFEFEKDSHRHSNFVIEDVSLPSAVHDLAWQRVALERIRVSDVVIVLLGQDTHNAPGVHDELALAGQARRPVVQLVPQHRRYGLISRQAPVCVFRWTLINQMLDDPKAFG